MSHETLLQVEHLGYRLGQRWLIKDVTTNVSPGFTALTGPNGAGKSTLMRAMAGVIPPTRGTVQIVGRPDPLRNYLGYIPQFPGAYENLTCSEFLLRTAWWDSPSQMRRVKDKAHWVMDEMGIGYLRERLGRHLTSSEKRRLALACVWMRVVQAILLDEPTAGLDPEQRLNFWQDLYELARREGAPRIFLITTHVLSEVERYCDNLIIMNHGQMRHQGPVNEFIDTARGHTYFVDARDRLLTLLDTGRVDESGYWVLAERGLSELRQRVPDLVDAYLWALYGQDRRQSSS